MSIRPLRPSDTLPGLFIAPCPPQWKAFLKTYPNQDGPRAVAKCDTVLLQQVSADVNRLGYTKDLFGDVWQPQAPGDCEDLALLKRQILVEKHGWKWGALSLVVCKELAGEGHALLCARTDQGDYLMDCRHPWIGPWRMFSWHYQLLTRHVQGEEWETLAAPVQKQKAPSSAGLFTRRSSFPSRDR